jgi:hypothetical protein
MRRHPDRIAELAIGARKLAEQPFRLAQPPLQQVQRRRQPRPRRGLGPPRDMLQKRLGEMQPVQPDLLQPRWAVIGIFLMLFVAGLAYARAFLMPVVLAVLLQLVFSPIRRQLERLGIPSGIAAALIVGALVVGLLGGVASLAVPASTWVERAPTIGWELRSKLGELQGVTDGMQRAVRQIEEIAAGGDDPAVQRVKVENERGALTIAMSLPGSSRRCFSRWCCFSSCSLRATCSTKRSCMSCRHSPTSDGRSGSPATSNASCRATCSRSL